MKNPNPTVTLIDSGLSLVVTPEELRGLEDFDWTYDDTKFKVPFYPVNNIRIAKRSEQKEGQQEECRVMFIKIIPKDKSISSKEVLHEIGHRGYRPAEPSEIAVVVKKYPEELKGMRLREKLRTLRIAAVNDISGNMYCCNGWVYADDGPDDSRMLHPFWPADFWHDFWWFAVVHK